MLQVSDQAPHVQRIPLFQSQFMQPRFQPTYESMNMNVNQPVPVPTQPELFQNIDTLSQHSAVATTNLLQNLEKQVQTLQDRLSLKELEQRQQIIRLQGLEEKIQLTARKVEQDNTKLQNHFDHMLQILLQQNVNPVKPDLVPNPPPISNITPKLLIALAILLIPLAALWPILFSSHHQNMTHDIFM